MVITSAVSLFACEPKKQTASDDAAQNNNAAIIDDSEQDIDDEDDIEGEGDDDDDEDDAAMQRLNANLKAIMDRDSFFLSVISADNLTVTVQDLTLTTVLTEQIADGVDYVDYGTYKTYAYAEDIDEENSNYYVLTDGEEKTYTLNAEDYGDFLDVWYSSFVSVKDANLLEEADFIVKVENDILTFEIKQNNISIYSLSAEKVNDVISQIAIIYEEAVDSYNVFAVYLTYGSAEVNKPDLGDYALAE